MADKTQLVIKPWFTMDLSQYWVVMFVVMMNENNTLGTWKFFGEDDMLKPRNIEDIFWWHAIT